MTGNLSLSDFIHRAEDELRNHQLPSPPLQYICEQGLAEDDSNGLWLEFGTSTGFTLRLMCEARQHGVVYSFDWFQGLPDDWRPEIGIVKGSFAMDPLANPPPNARLVVGRFEETLKPFLEQHPDRPARLVHIDCDIYLSTKTVLTLLTNRLQSGTIQVFDELQYYPGREHQEAKALYEWLGETGRSFRWIGIHGNQSSSEIHSRAAIDPEIKTQLLDPDQMIVPWHMPLNERVALQLL